jgi:hypothetical protein
MRKRSIITGLAIAALLLSACGGSKKSSMPSAHSSSNTTASTMATTTTAPNPAADQVQAQKLVLTKSDVPAGWTDSPATQETADDRAIDDQLDTCEGIPSSEQSEVANVNGDSFSQNDNTIDSSVSSLKTVQLVQQDFAASTDSAHFPCISNVLSQSIKSSLGGDAGSASVSTTIAPLAGVTSGSNQFAMRATSSVKLPTTTVTAYIDLIGIASGRFEVTLTVTYFGSVPPASLEKSLVAAEVAHINATTAA